ncbi:MAG TPA: 30S ribosomal protein S16 [bacterium]|nr:30S ribosomal protein S16 [bacterium]
MLTIKLAKIGKTNKKMFRIVICEKTKDPYGKALEILGSYNPYSKELKVKADRVKHWISKGAAMTPSINNLFITNKIVEGQKAKNSKPGTPNKKKVEKIEKAKKKEAEAQAQAEKAKIESEEAKKEATSEPETPVENQETTEEQVVE